ncbi:AAA family ATPase [Streptomyces luomodiensis]|uniref:AAA family ATPase n=1 Tax=Streptomyces luomodiensis TaxID=3026192 RepID=A0ABY9VF92_9ACTN|nr:AAA family ATPase [Streptomyces sp. SCA4-21]WNF01381.1 AAA family ATPase [Streptomyces sp. SCA4-21]
MYLGRVRAKGFKSLLNMDVPLRQGVTVVVGENNAGKSNFIDALRLLTDPLDGRRSRWWEAEDVHPWAEACAELTAVYGGLTPAEAGTHLQALVPAAEEPGLPEGHCARYTVQFTRRLPTPGRSVRCGRRADCWMIRSRRRAALSGTSTCRRCATPSRSWLPVLETGCG